MCRPKTWRRPSSCLPKLGFDDIPDFLDYALAEARKTRFDVQTLSGLKQYLAGYLAGRQRRAAARATQAAREATRARY